MHNQSPQDDQRAGRVRTVRSSTADRELLERFARHLRDVVAPLHRTLVAIDDLRQFQARARVEGVELPLDVPDVAQLRSFGHACAEGVANFVAIVEARDDHAVRSALHRERD